MTKWISSEITKNKYFVKTSKTEWFEVQDDVLLDSLVEISRRSDCFSRRSDCKGYPIVTLQKYDGTYIRLGQGKLWSGTSLYMLNLLHSGHWSESISRN
mgnify:CR=1 FL=1